MIMQSDKSSRGWCTSDGCCIACDYGDKRLDSSSPARRAFDQLSQQGVIRFHPLFLLLTASNRRREEERRGEERRAETRRGERRQREERRQGEETTRGGPTEESRWDSQEGFPLYVSLLRPSTFPHYYSRSGDGRGQSRSYAIRSSTWG